ncbi:DUF3352 domain-containing protein [Candidatus Peregrinibacteria bacterium]|nr:DUF3352 domain-containing protein [Candidatus Peregrinibacteria bacterium]
MSKNLLLKKLLERRKNKTTLLDRLLFAILGIGFLMMIAFFVYLLWFTLTNRSATYILPAEKTVAYFELKDLTLPPRLDQKTIFNLTGLSAVLKQTFQLDMEDLQEQLSQGRLGLALIKNGDNKNKLVLFFRIRSQKQALAFFEGLGMGGEKLTVSGDKKLPIYSYPQSNHFSFSFIGPYLFIAEKPSTLEMIQAVYRGEDANLNADPAYRKSLANLPRQAWGYGYLNIQALYFGDNNPLSQLIDPLKNITDHLVLTIQKEYNGFHFNTLLSLDPKLLALKKGYTDSTRFAYSLADFLGSQNLAAYIGGANLSDEWQNTLETISQLNPAYGIILEGVVRAQVNRIFGEDVSLRNDIYPLFEGEYALAFEYLENGQLGIKLILKHNDRTFAEVKLKKLLEGFQTLAAQFAPRLKEFTLPDGTESRELVADPSRLKEISEIYEDYEINCLDVSDSAYGFCYAVTDELIIMGNHPESIKETIDLSISPRFILSQSQSFRQALSNLSAVSDEITFVDLQNLHPLLMNTPLGVYSQNLLSSFEAVTWIKHYFNDGVSTEGYLLLK